MSWGSAKQRMCWNNLRVFLFLTLKTLCPAIRKLQYPNSPEGREKREEQRRYWEEQAQRWETAVGFRWGSACPSGEKSWRECDGLPCYCMYYVFVFLKILWSCLSSSSLYVLLVIMFNLTLNDTLYVIWFCFGYTLWYSLQHIFFLEIIQI